MSQVSTNAVVDAFKKVYGEVRDLQPEDQMLAKMIPFEAKAKVGDSYVEAMILSGEVG